MSTLFRNATLITAETIRQADLRVEGETIAAVGEGLPAEGAEVVDCTGKLIFPGGVDPHTHFDLPMFGTVSSDDHYTGHRAAAFGGTTTVMDFVPQDRSTLQESVEDWRSKAAKAAVDYGFHMNVTRWTPAIAAEVPVLKEMGITTLKVFMAYNGRLRLSDREIFEVMRIAKNEGMLVMLHAENGDVIEVLTAEALAAGRTSPAWHARTRPAWSAAEAVLRGCALAAQAEAPLYIVHMNSAGEVDLLDYARRHGAPAMGETCPQYLFFTEDNLSGPDGAKWVCSPPVRTVPDQERLWAGLSDHTLQVVATDHCPFFFDGARAIRYEDELVRIPGKELGREDFTRIPNGVPGVADRLPVLWSFGVRTGRITPERFVQLTSTNAARIFGLYPRKGSLLPGADADLVIWDPERKKIYGREWAQQRTDYNLFEGWELLGFPERVYLRGRCIVSHDRWLGERGGGRFLARQAGEVI